MFKTRTRKIFRDIWARKGRSFMVILSIMIGVFAVTTMLSITDLLNRQLEEDVKSEQISHTHVYVISGGETITAEENTAYLETLYSLPGVVDVEGQAIYPISWVSDDELHDAVMVSFSEPLGVGDLETISRLVDGRYPQAGEIAVEPRFAAANDLEIGDTLQFPNTGDQEWEIVGLLLHPYYTEFPATQTSVTVQEKVFANYEDAQQIAGFTGFSAIHVKYETMAQSTEGMNDLVAAIANNTPYVAAFTYQDNPDENFMVSVISDLTGAMDALGIVAMVVSGFLVTNVLNTVILEQRRQIGAMKSLGATFADTFRIYAGMALFYGIIGTTLGLLLAIPVAANTARPIASWLGAYIEGYKISPLGIGVGLTMGLLVPMFAAFVPVLQSSRISILDAVTDLGIASSWGKSRIARLIGKLPFPVVVRQALSNIWQKKGRLTLTIATLTLAVGAFMGATAIGSTLDGFVDDLVGIHDYEIRITPQRAEDYDRLTSLVTENIEGVTAVYPGVDVAVRVPGFVSETPLKEGSDQITASGFDPATPTYKFDLLEGSGWEDDPTRPGIVIARPIAEQLNKNVGDTLEFEINGEEFSYEIIGVDAYLFDVIFMNWEVLADISGYVDASEQPLASTAFVFLSGDASIDTIEDKIDDITTLLSDNGIQGTYHNQPEAAELQAEQTTMLSLIFQTMSIAMAAVGAIGLLAALSMAVLERQKEIGVMRSVGARSRTVMSQFMTEGILIGVVSWLVAIPISVVMAIGFLSLLPGDYMRLDYPPELIAIGLVGVLMVVTVASLWPSFTASRKTIAHILRYQ